MGSFQRAMKLVMVGGHSRNIGKTSVVEGIIRALPELGWTAVKITQYGHDVCTLHGESCRCSATEHAFAIDEERESTTGTDSARFLAAGARRSLWVRTRQGELFTALPALQQQIENDIFVIVESNSLRRFLKPALYLQVLDPRRSDFKVSSQQFFDLANGYVIVGPSTVLPSSPMQFLEREIQKDKPVFTVRPEERFMSSDLIQFVRRTLEL